MTIRKPEGANRMKHELQELLKLRDARIAELEKALREVRDLAQPEARMRVANKFLMEVKP